MRKKHVKNIFKMLVTEKHFNSIIFWCYTLFEFESLRDCYTKINI